jgi:hypothetical protein
LKKEERLGTFSPKVTELLAWLSSLIPDEEESQASLTSLNYLLNSDGKAEIHLTLQAPESVASGFLEKLRQREGIVDHESKILWKKEKSGSYSAQFLLR